MCMGLYWSSAQFDTVLSAHWAYVVPLLVMCWAITDSLATHGARYKFVLID